METKLYLGNLAFSTTETELRSLFAEAGRVVFVKVITDRISGSSKGFGFLEMSNPAEAEKAISLFNGYTLNNRVLKVNPARPREEAGTGGGFRSPRRDDSNRGRGQGVTGGGRHRNSPGEDRRN